MLPVVCVCNSVISLRALPLSLFLSLSLLPASRYLHHIFLVIWGRDSVPLFGVDGGSVGYACAICGLEVWWGLGKRSPFASGVWGVICNSTLWGNAVCIKWLEKFTVKYLVEVVESILSWDENLRLEYLPQLNCSLREACQYFPFDRIYLRDRIQWSFSRSKSLAHGTKENYNNEYGWRKFDHRNVT